MASTRQLRDEAMASAGSGGSGSTSGSGSGDVHATTSLLPPVDPTDTCLWAPGRECSVPRSCHDCLNSAASKGQCMVDPVGRCVALQPLDAATDFRSRGSVAGELHVYSSTNTSYCESSDATCAACRARTDASGWYYTRDGSANGSANGASLVPFCVGADGCVCVAACEAPAWQTSVLALCSAQRQATQARQTGLYVVVMGVATALCAFLFFFSARWMKTRPPTDPEDELAPTPLYLRRATRRPTLSLPAWHALRQKLIDDETERRELRASHRGTTVLVDSGAATAATGA